MEETHLAEQDLVAEALPEVPPGGVGLGSAEGELEVPALLGEGVKLSEGFLNLAHQELDFVLLPEVLVEHVGLVYFFLQLFSELGHVEMALLMALRQQDRPLAHTFLLHRWKPLSSQDHLAFGPDSPFLLWRALAWTAIGFVGTVDGAAHRVVVLPENLTQLPLAKHQYTTAKRTQFLAKPSLGLHQILQAISLLYFTPLGCR